jgi:hypothetical protein
MLDSIVIDGFGRWPRRIKVIAGIARRARHSCRTAGAKAIADPRSITVHNANPAASHALRTICHAISKSKETSPALLQRWARLCGRGKRSRPHDRKFHVLPLVPNCLGL